MTMKSIFRKTLSIVALFSMVLFTGCLKDLDTIPLDPDITSSIELYEDFENYELVLAKCYAGLSLTGQQAGAGDPDIVGFDEGFSQYFRCYFYCQELTTDEAGLAWSDGTLKEFLTMSWSSANEFIRTMYYRLYFQITLCNEFILQTTPGKLDERGFNDEQKAVIAAYRTEARYLRAFSYYHALDMFGNVPFVTEETGVGSYLPEQISRADLFDYVESELLAVADDLPDPQGNDYGRVDKACAWTLLTRLYLNSKVYNDTERYTDAITYAKKVISEGGYVLEDTYANMFLADNNTADGIIFAIPYHGETTQNYGGTMFLISAQIGGSMQGLTDFGTNEAWWGLRVKQQLVAKFPSDNSDSRKMFYTDGHTLEMTNLFDYTNGYGSTKWKNITSTGANGSSTKWPDTDLPLFRLADVYLMYAEAVLRGGTGGDATTALGYVNEIREKAYGGTSGNIASGELTLDFILDERARELWFEGYRRTDLIRFGKFTGNAYLWDWKGGVLAGATTDAKYSLFPIPDADRTANPNLDQNTGY